MNHRINNIYNTICDNHETLSDEGLAYWLKAFSREIPGGAEIHFPRLEEILKKRVIEYCEKNDMELIDYNGVLPFRSHKVPVKAISPEEIEAYLNALSSGTIGISSRGIENLTTVPSNRFWKWFFKSKSTQRLFSPIWRRLDKIKVVKNVELVSIDHVNSIKDAHTNN